MLPWIPRISVRVRGGEAQGPSGGLDGMNLGLIRDMGAAFFESHCELNDKTSSPFSSNRTMFETEEVLHLSHTHTQQKKWNISIDKDSRWDSFFSMLQMVIPADPEEMRQFQAQCVAQCQCAVDISFPLAYILLPSKQAFQSIYNR